MIGGPLSLQQCVSAAAERHASFHASFASSADCPYWSCVPLQRGLLCLLGADQMN